MPAPRQAWLTPLVLLLGVIFAAGMGLYSYARIASPPLHPNPDAAPSVQDASPPPRWADAVKHSQQLVRTELAAQDLPGLSVAVGVDGALVWAEGFGYADVEQRTPVRPKTRFRIGHASKALTSAGVGLLLERGRLNLDDEIQTYVPEFPKKPWPITLRQLMGHVAGIRHYESEADQRPTTHCERASEGLSRFANDPLRFEPETEYRYSIFGWVLVSAAVESAAGEPFFTFMRTQIFNPLGMTGTTVDSSSESIPDRTTFYESGFVGMLRPVSGLDYSCFAGGGAFLSTPSDLVRFGLAMSGGKLLQPFTVTKLQTSQGLRSGAETAYGLGWMLDTVPLAGESVRLANHASRTVVGSSVSFLTFPDRGLVVAVTTNINYAITRHIALGIAEAFETNRRRPAGK